MCLCTPSSSVCYRGCVSTVSPHSFAQDTIAVSLPLGPATLGPVPSPSIPWRPCLLCSAVGLSSRARAWSGSLASTAGWTTCSQAESRGWVGLWRGRIESVLDRQSLVTLLTGPEPGAEDSADAAPEQCVISSAAELGD